MEGVTVCLTSALQCPGFWLSALGPRERIRNLECSWLQMWDPKVVLRFRTGLQNLL